MTPEGRAKLEAAGVDYAGAVHRFLNNDSMYEKFLVKFLEDENYKKLEDGIASGDYANIFPFTHTIKGTAGNLGLVPVSKVADIITELVRNKTAEEIDCAAVDSNMLELREEYKKMCDVISSVV